MNRLGLFFCTLIVFLPAGAVRADEIVKWTDENGKVHFSDTAPQDKSIVAEVITATEAPLQGLTAEELKQQQKRTTEYKVQLNKRLDQEKEDRKNALQAKKPTQPHPERSDADREADKITCRNKYILTKPLADCLKKATQ